MEIKLQNFLKGLDKNGDGVRFNELKSLDLDSNGEISGTEIPVSGLSKNDQLEINAKYSSLFKVNNFFSGIVGNSIIYNRSELNSELFPGGIAGIKPEDVQQGNLNDCFFLSALAALAKQRPESIPKMIKDNNNGTYTVKFPGAVMEVTVSKPTEEELQKYSHNGENGSTWAAVLEKAYAKYMDKLIPVNTGGERSKIDKGGLLSMGIGTVTGHFSIPYVLDLTPDFILKWQLKSALNSGKVVTASTFLAGNSDKNISKNHVFSVLSYDPQSETVRVRNPWGANEDAKGIKFPDDKNDGTFSLTLAEFRKYFKLFEVETSFGPLSEL
jgi:hypothetical protein